MKLTYILSALSLIHYCEGYEALKSYLGRSKLKIGAAVNTNYFSNEEYIEAAKNFNMIVAENGCKLSAIQYKQGVYDYTDCDKHYELAISNNMEFRGHCLLWHSYPPSWFEKITSSEVMNTTIVEHITNVLTHYKGKIKIWDVVNEAIDDSSTSTSYIFRDSFIYQALPNFVDIAFKTARQVDPSVKLFYNDYNNEGKWDKTYAVYLFVKDLVEREIPIDGVGLQYHVSVQYQPTLAKVNDIIGKYCDLGLEVHITEMDVKCENKCDAENVDDLQNTVYSNALKACLSNKCCTGFLVWGIGDNNSWVGEENKPLLFDSSYEPKPQYTALLNILKDTLGETEYCSSTVLLTETVTQTETVKTTFILTKYTTKEKTVTSTDTVYTSTDTTTVQTDYTSTITTTDVVTTTSTDVVTSLSTDVVTSTLWIKMTESPDCSAIKTDETNDSISLLSFRQLKSFLFFYVGILLIYLYKSFM